MPLIRQLPICPFVNGRVVAVGSELLQFTVMFAGAEIIGSGAGFTVMILETEAIGRPQASLGALQVSKTVPPQASGVLENVDGSDVPLIRQPPLILLLKAR